MIERAHKLLICASMLGSICSPAWAQNFMRRYDALNQFRSESGFGIEKADTGYVIFLGAAYDTDSIYYGSVVTTLHVSGTGEVIDTHIVELPWHNTFPGWANVAFPLANGGFGAAGDADDTTGFNKPALYLFDESGALTSIQLYGEPGEVWIGYQGKQTPDGGFVIVGVTNATGVVDAFLLKLDSSANEQWTRTYGHITRGDYGLSVDLAPGGGYYIGGYRFNGNADKEAWVIRVDAEGDQMWSQPYGSGMYDTPAAQVQTLADSSLMIGTQWVVSGAGGYCHLVKVLPNGITSWAYNYGRYSVNTFLAVKEIIPSGDLIVAGYAEGNPYMEGALLRTNADGDSLWMRYYHYYDSLWTEGEGMFRDVIPTDDGGFIAVGAAASYSNNPNDPPGIYSQDTWVVKVDSLGCIEPGCNDISTVTTQITNFKDALTITPNPASDKVRIAWQLPDSLRNQSAQLHITSSQGGLIRTVALDLSAGSVEVDVRTLVAGIYHVHVVQGGTWITGGKMIIQ